MRAHLWGNAKQRVWIEYPKRMLMARTRAYALRDGFADCLMGLSIREEIEDVPAEPPARTDTSFLDDAPAAIAGEAAPSANGDARRTAAMPAPPSSSERTPANEISAALEGE